MTPETLYVIIAGLYGLIAGSFINAYVWRTHLQETTKEKGGAGSRSDSKTGSSSILRGRSACPNCKHLLAAKDLVPVFSWLMLRGKCRYCLKRISWQYPLVEVLTASLFVLTVIWWPSEITGVITALQLLVALGITVMFLALSVYDIRWYLLPDKMVLVLLGLVTLFHLLTAAGGAPVSEWLITPLIGALGAFAFFYALYALGRGKWMGGGDVKLVFVLGLLVGGVSSVVGMFIAFISASIIGVALILTGLKSRRDMVPFGPFLLAGFWLAWFFGDRLADWYVRLITGI